MSLSRAGTLDQTDIQGMYERVWVSKERSLADEAGEVDRATLCATLLDLQLKMATLIGDLPSGAFEPQPDDIDGSDIWSAGEIVAHLAAMEVDSLPYWESVCGLRIADPPLALLQAADRAPSGREACLEAMQAIQGQARQLYRQVAGRCSGDETAVHFALGQVNVRTALLGSCLHLMDHYQQLESLGRHHYRPGTGEGT